MKTKSAIISCSVLIILIAITALRYVAPASSNEIPQYTRSDFEQVLHPAQLILIGEKIDINVADEEAFDVLYRVGPKLAERIVEDRELNGPFASVDDLARVHGIGPTIIQKNRSYLKAITPTEF